VSLLITPIPDIERVSKAKLLSVIFNKNLKFNSHVKAVLTLCSQRFYLFRCLRNQGLSLHNLSIIFDALIISRIIYALPVWGRFISAEVKDQLDCFMRRMFCYKFTGAKVEFDNLLIKYDRKLFDNTYSNNNLMT